ncbi:MAG: hypothetical protein PSU94_00485 [Lacunisphaera sp.]|nr:hypothetical protein [Lacunisphaera sp.]
MSTSAHRLALALLLATLAFAGCASSPMSRIDANRALYESWPFEIQEAVLNGRIVAGMTHEMVEMVVGKPSQVTSRSARKGEEEVWTYKKGGGLGQALQNSNISLGGSVGPVYIGGLGGGGSGAPAEVDEMDVVFQNGVVIRSDAGLNGSK